MQVYKGRLRSSGAVVAVKVQRPGVRESIALDIHILRMILTQVLLPQTSHIHPSLSQGWTSIASCSGELVLHACPFGAAEGSPHGPGINAVTLWRSALRAGLFNTYNGSHATCSFHEH